MFNKIPLGIRLNNPANIRYNSLNHWYGQVGQSKGFCKFSTVECGVRALLVLLRTYYCIYGLKSIRQIISRYAPSNENNTDAYIEFIVQYMLDNHRNLTADDDLYLNFYACWDTTLFILASGICKIESGYSLSLDTFKSVLSLIHSN